MKGNSEDQHFQTMMLQCQKKKRTRRRRRYNNDNGDYLHTKLFHFATSYWELPLNVSTCCFFFQPSTSNCRDNIVTKSAVSHEVTIQNKSPSEADDHTPGVDISRLLCNPENI